MKTKPILFSTEMVQAILEGRKTQTRRIKKSEKPKHQKGDILWVRETWVKLHEAYLYKLIPEFDSPHFFYCYKADGEPVHFEHYGENWRPSIFMPKEAARIFLEVTDVRVERLQSISNSDALSEGIKVIEEDEDYFDYENNGEAGSYGTARGSFFSLWRKIYGDKCFDNNPFVWVYEFKQVEKPFNFF